MDGGKVAFTPPASGASAAISGSPATIAGGTVRVSATANSIPGGPYDVTAITTGASSVNFALTNLRSGADDFVITVKTDNPGTSSNTQFTIPTYSGETYNYNVDCDNDGLDEATAQTGNYTCSYASAGTYTISIKDNSGAGTGFPRIYFY